MGPLSAIEGPVYFDTNVVIAIIEGTGPLSPAQAAILNAIDEDRLPALTSELTLAECLVKPFAERNAVAIEAFLSFLDGRPSFPTMPVTRDLLLDAARLRAETRLRLPDAIHMVTATRFGCRCFLTEDRDMKPAAGLGIISWNALAVR